MNYRKIFYNLFYILISFTSFSQFVYDLYNIQDYKNPEQIKLELLTSLINSESHGETFEDKLMVGTVVMNRVDSKYFPDNINDVIYQPKQFSGINHKLFRCDTTYYMSERKTQTKKMDYDSYKAAKTILEGYRSFGEDVLYFYNPLISTDKTFINNMNDIAFIGENHWFTKN